MKPFSGKIFLLLLIAMISISCEEDKIINTAGRISYINLEGGFYGIYGDDGVSYDPINLPADFQKDSLRVLFQGKIITEQTSVHMWGKLIQLQSIEKLH